jgi:hypothetical protein
MVFVIFGYQETWVGMMKPGGDKPVRYRQVEASSDGLLFASAMTR